MKKYFVTSDIHGFYTLWMKELVKNGFDINNDEHILIVCGDIIDRGKESEKVIDFLYNLPKERRILIMGNHEELFEELIYRGTVKERDIRNGTFFTFIRLFYKDIINELDFEDVSLLKKICDITSKINDYEESKLYYLIRQMVDYYETNNYVFVHGWIPLGVDDNGNRFYSEKWREGGPDNWYFARWTNGMEANINGLNIPNKTIVCGHYRTSYGNVRKNKPRLSDLEYNKIEFSDLDYFNPYKDKGIIAIDACTKISNKVNVIVFNEDEL